MLTNRFTLAKKIAVAIVLVMSVLLTAPSAHAQGTGILPIPEYSGDLAKRSYIFGDLGGKRTEWAQRGFTFDLDYNQYFQAVTDGGLDTGSEYGGTVNYNFNLDFDRMGVIPGGLLQLRARSRYGSSINDVSGSIVPVNTDATLLTASSPDKNIALWLPVINYTQFFSETFALSFGKFDTLDSTNEFAGGRGRTQFWNQNLNMPLAPLLITPNVTTGVTAVYLPNPNLTFAGMVGTITDTSSSSGLNDLNDGLFALGSATYQYQLNALPGGLVFMSGYGWDRDFTDLNGRIGIDDGQLVSTTKDDTWFASISFWQYLWTKEAASQPIDLSDGRQDLQGIGAFFRLQTADSDTNAMDYSVAGGLSAKGLFPSRDNDAMGIAYVYNKLPDDGLLEAIGIDAQSSAWELFYNIELTPAVHVTLDAQVVKSAFPDVDTAKVFGVSMQIVF